MLDIRLEDDQDNTEGIKLSEQGDALETNVEKKEEREHWGSHTEFLLASIGFAIGIGNVWRFGVLAYQYGGGSFLIPYLTALIFLALPLFILEMLLGQTLQLGTYHALKFIHPRLRGVGIAACMTVAYVAVYYNVLLGYIILYLFQSFREPMPWGTPSQRSEENVTEIIANASMMLPAESFWTDEILQQSETAFEFGNVVWPIMMVSLLAWLLVFVSLRKGLATSGKLLYVTAILPLVILVALACVTMTLNGALKGAQYYIKPSWKHLLDINVWHIAAQQVFYSLGPGFGTVISLASYNSQRYDAVRDSILVGVINSATSIISGFVVFGFLGHLAELRGVEVDEVVQAGQGLVFIAIPQALAGLEGAGSIFRHFLTALFFIMLFFLGIDTQFANVETVITLVKDLGCTWGQTTIVAVLCTLGFVFSSPMATQGGIFWFDLMDTHAALFILFIIVLLELLAVRFLFGFDRLTELYHEQSGKRIGPVLIFVWKWVCPVYALFLLVVTIIAQFSKEAEEDRPLFATVAAWFFSLSPLIPIILCSLTDDLTFKQKGTKAIHEMEHVGQEATSGFARYWKSMFGKRYLDEELHNPDSSKFSSSEETKQQEVSKVFPT